MSLLMLKLLICTWSASLSIDFSVIAFGCKEQREIQISSISNTNSFSTIFSVLKNCSLWATRSSSKFISPSKWFPQRVRLHLYLFPHCNTCIYKSCSIDCPENHKLNVSIISIYNCTSQNKAWYLHYHLSSLVPTLSSQRV